MTTDVSVSTMDYARLSVRNPTAVTILASHGPATETTLGDLFDEGLKVGAGLAHHGIRAGDRVLLVLPTSAEYLAILVGCLATGVVPCTVAVPPTPDKPHSAAVRHLLAATSVVGPRAVIAAPEVLAALPGSVVRGLSPDALLAFAPLNPDELPHPQAETPHHIQLTSGSTSTPKAVALTHRAMAANAQALASAIELDPERDRVCSWLPLYHDMGLVQILSAFVRSIPVDLMSPMTYLRDPLFWLRAIQNRRGTITAAPPFGYRSAVERFRKRPDPDLDLSSLRFAFVGAEPIPPIVLEEFQHVFSSSGLGANVLVPCYGMAETVLATSLAVEQEPGTGRHRGYVRTLSMDHVALAEQGRVAPSTQDRPETLLVSCGPPIPGMAITVRDENGQELPEGRVGTLHVSGDSVMAGYLDGEKVQPLPDRVLDTGDLGFLWQSETYIVGRAKEMLIVRGRNIPPYDLEEVIEEHPQVEQGRSVVFSVPDPQRGTEAVVAVVELRPKDLARASEVRAELNLRVRQTFGFGLDEVEFVARGSLPRTSSGKRQRARLRREYLGRHSTG